MCAELCGAKEILKLKTYEEWSDGETREEWWKRKRWTARMGEKVMRK